jgi:hypothetical protein
MLSTKLMTSRQQVGYSTVRRDARNLGCPVGT